MAKRKAGQLLQQMPKNEGSKGIGVKFSTNECGDTVSPHSEPTYQELGIHKKQASRWQTMAELAETEFEDLLSTNLQSGKELSSNQVLGAVLARAMAR